MKRLRIKGSREEVNGELTLNGSKSISNRVLIIQALCGEDFEITGLSTSDDTIALQKALASTNTTIDIGAAGTTMRFLTAYFSVFGNDALILTGSDRMKKRPIGILVDALQSLGANIEYEGDDGFPPLKINGSRLKGGHLKIDATVSSQFISALLLIASSLENGLQLELVGNLVSRPYLEMTLNLMKFFGVNADWIGQTIDIKPQKYKARKFQVEADWSAASYHYAIVAFAKKGRLKLNGFFKESVQGDSVLSEMMEFFGVRTIFHETGIELVKIPHQTADFNYDFIRCPDLAQTIAVVCAGLQVQGTFSGLQTLAIKETDRTKALEVELDKMKVSFRKANDSWEIGGETPISSSNLAIDTYHDHRMAMAFAPLSVFFDNGLIINNPDVVSKSYIYFWKDLVSLGFEVEEILQA